MLTSRELQLRHSGVDEMESERSSDWVDAEECCVPLSRQKEICLPQLDPLYMAGPYLL